MKNWKAVVGVIFVFLLGMAAGGLITAKVYQKHISKIIAGKPQAVVGMIERRLDAQLRLDTNQREQLRIVIHEAYKEIQNVRKQVQPQIKDILERSEKNVRAILNPKQTEKFDRIIAEQKVKWGVITQEKH